jgi:hypothetical protein
MHRRLALSVIIVTLAAGASWAVAQQSANFKLTEFTLNAGGDPLNGSSAASPSWKISLDALGDAILGVGTSSASWHMDSGFVDVYRSAGEVQKVRWTSSTLLNWDPEKSVGVYNLYRDLIGNLPGAFGNCFQSSVTGESWTDASIPGLNTAWFYLVTAENRLSEEGTKGYSTGGAERPNPSPCP